ncbi:MAG: class I SAM-dependent methyltransferase [Bacillota bacterium]
MVEQTNDLSHLTEVIKRRYNRSALYYDWLDRMIDDGLRKKALGFAKGKVLEVGVGTGRNLPYYPADCEITGIDFSPGMLAKARKRVHQSGAQVTLLEIDVQQMDFPDNTFDTIVSTCVFCSVPDPVKGLTEARRVCKPDGQIILLEHVRSEHPVLGALMDLLNPLTLYMIGSSINRRTVENIQKAGIKITSIEDRFGKILKLIVATP